MKKQTAFTLIEMMIVIVIVAILVAIAYPNYGKQVLSARRTEARGALLDYTMRFEEYYSTNYSYTSADTFYGLDATPETENSYYQLSADIGAAGDSFTITATAINGQTKDTDCSTITIDQTGQKLPSDCW